MVWVAWYAKAKGLNGFLRWAYDYWTKADPQDVRDGSNTAGDFSLIYRSDNSLSSVPLSSIRLELLREGIQDYPLHQSDESRCAEVYVDFGKIRRGNSDGSTRYVEKDFC